MERAGVGTAMLMLTALSVITPAAEWLGGSKDPESLVMSSPVSATTPTRSAQELREVLNAYRNTGESASTNSGSRKARSARLRDPFAAPPFAVSSPAVPEEVVVMPVVELLGIIESPEGGIATISIDGDMASLRAGESANGVLLRGISPPEQAEVEVLKVRRTVKVR